MPTPTSPTRAPEPPTAHARPQRITLPGTHPMRARGDAEGPNRPTRTYRSTSEAFPRTTDYAYAGVVYKRRLGLEGRVAVAALLIGLLGAAVVAWGFPAPARACTTDTDCGCTIDCLEPAR